jgi:hypothetical protein
MPNDGVSESGRNPYRKGLWQFTELSFGIVWNAA